MANKKRNMYKPKPMTEGKRNIIQGLLQEYEIESAEDIQDALKDLLFGTIQGMLESEMNDILAMANTNVPKNTTTAMAQSQNLSVANMVSLKQTCLKTDRVHLSLRLSQSGKKIFQGLRIRLFRCMQRA